MTRSRALHRRLRGFTLLELMAAIGAGVFVSAAAFAFARASSRAYQQDIRLSTATSSTNLGFRRLINEIQRAGFLGTPNIQRDRRNCQNLTTAPQGIKDLASLRVTPFGAFTGPVNPSSTINGTAPDTVILAGSLESPDDYPVEVDGVGPVTMTFKRQFEQAASTDRAGVAGLQRYFQIGRIVRLVNDQGLTQFGVVTGQGMSAGGDFQAIVDQVFFKPATCPAKPAATQGMIPTPTKRGLASVVNRVRYELKSLQSEAGFAELYPSSDVSIGAGQTVPVDVANKVELVRTELNAFDAPLGSPELVSEFAVDLRVGGTIDTATTVGSQTIPPVLTAFPPTLPGGAPGGFYNFTGAVSASPLALGPERVRSVNVRLTVRSREYDRRFNAAAPPTTGVGIFRFLHPTEPRWARARTLNGEVFLSNQAVGEGSIL